MRGKLMIVLGLFIMLVGLELIREGVKSHLQEQSNTLKADMLSKGYHVVKAD